MERDYIHWALTNTKTAVEDVLHNAFPEHPWYKGYLTGKGNFRDEIATIKKYKGNRDPKHKPKYYAEIRQYLLDVYKAELVTGKEADDAVATEQWSHPDKSTVIVSIDKDLDMIPGYHYNPKKGLFYYVTIDEANLAFFRQMLVGDSTDNIPGITGLGPVKSRKLLPDGMAADEAANVVRAEYLREYGPDKWQEAYAEVATLLWMIRKEGEGCPFL
jgi:5'-3' exonuclease